MPGAALDISDEGVSSFLSPPVSVPSNMTLPSVVGRDDTASTNLTAAGDVAGTVEDFGSRSCAVGCPG